MLKFTYNNNVKKREIDRKINLYSHCMNSDFKKFQNTDKKEQNDLLKC